MIFSLVEILYGAKTPPPPPIFSSLAALFAYRFFFVVFCFSSNSFLSSFFCLPRFSSIHAHSLYTERSCLSIAHASITINYPVETLKAYQVR